jgi:hypothetical protein
VGEGRNQEKTDEQLILEGRGKYRCQDGNPVYVIKSTPAISIIEVPDELRKKG